MPGRLTSHHKRTRRWVELARLGLVCAIIGAGCRGGGARSAALRNELASAVSETQRFDPGDPLERSAASDPLGFLEMCLREYQKRYEDYRCRFLIRERSDGRLREPQVIAVDFREHPFSVEMRWLHNAERANRVSYVEGRWSRGGREFAHIELAGLLGLLTPSGIKLDIHAPQARAAARGTIDEFGFRHTLISIIDTSREAAGDSEFSLSYVGTSQVSGRPCLVFERRLPPEIADKHQRSRLLYVHIDREWLVPTACVGYMDHQGQRLLGSYVTTDVEFNVGLDDADF